uniref:Methylated-DNA--protein-cysteine methyltransferase n=1 Tax=Aceria tosichella TaxID=561515 RepID=A0A6G1S986_9ACAR
MEKLKADETLDFHNKQIQEVALGERCPNSDKSSAYILTSPLGHVYTNACPNGLHCVKLYGDTSYDDIKWDTKVDFIRASSFMPSNEHAKQLKKWLQMYFSNPIKCKDIELKFCGLEEYGEFNSKIWTTIYDTCPPGELMSYSELAQRSGYGAGASKVVGYAINKNPYMLVVGDHRVIKASGEIWCENESQRNKLRRLLVKYEISHTKDTFEQALLKVKERNTATKGTRKRATAVKSEASGSQKKTRGVKKPAGKKASTSKKTTTRRKRKVDESDEEDDDDDDSFIDDEED